AAVEFQQAGRVGPVRGPYAGDVHASAGEFDSGRARGDVAEQHRGGEVVVAFEEVDPPARRGQPVQRLLDRQVVQAVARADQVGGFLELRVGGGDHHVGDRAVAAHFGNPPTSGMPP